MLESIYSYENWPIFDMFCFFQKAGSPAGLQTNSVKLWPWGTTVANFYAISPTSAETTHCAIYYLFLAVYYLFLTKSYIFSYGTGFVKI